MTREEWNDLWWDEFFRLHKEFYSRDLQVLHKAATMYMKKRHGVCPGDRPSVMDRIKDKETGMGKVLKFLDGWKLVIGVVVLAAVKAWDMAHNGHAGDYVGILLALVGYTPGAEWGDLAANMGASALVIWGGVHKLVKAARQAKAGAAPSDLLSTGGYVAEAEAKK